MASWDELRVVLAVAALPSRRLDRARAHSPLAKKIDDAFQTSLKEVGGWRKIAEVAFSVQRNRVA